MQIQLSKIDQAQIAIFGSGCVALFFATAAVYWPGLSGPFLFDDFGTLAELGDQGGVRDWFSFKAYVLGGYSGPTGRPLSLLSFLIDANNWPADPWPFKRTNLLIHLINGVLLGVISSMILRSTGIEKQRAGWLALICAGLWLLHPFLVSTTLYAVQRMAQLSTLFIFLGLICYVRGRSLLGSKPIQAYLTMSLALVLGTFLASISKENGILLPLLVLLLETTGLSGGQRDSSSPNRYWVLAFLVAPAVVVVSYLGLKGYTAGFFEITPPRDFSTYERLLTESRILVDYLRHWFLPDLYTAGVFQDHYVKSTGLLAPVTTLISIIFHAVLIGVCIAWRRKWPLFAFGALFYYGSHLLESTVLNLELYFEHRNYLATAFLFMPLVVKLHEKLSIPVFSTIILSAMLVLGGFTRYTSTVWADYPRMAEASAKIAPTSARAQQQYALNLYNAKQYDEALQVLDSAIERIPNNEQLIVLRISILCYLGVLSDDEFEKLESQFSMWVFDPRSMGLYDTLFAAIVSSSCPSITANDLRGLFASMLNVPLNADPNSLRYAHIRYYIGRADIQLSAPAEAMENFKASLAARPGASRAMHMAALMATAGFLREALQLSDVALAALEVEMGDLMAADLVSENDIREFQDNIRAELENEPVD